MPSAAWSYRLRLAWERRKLAVSETLLRLRGVEGELLPPQHTPPLSLDECPHEVKKQRDRLRVAEAQSDWFVSEVHRHRALGIPVGCCDEWPECSHMLAYYEEHREEILGR